MLSEDIKYVTKTVAKIYEKFVNVIDLLNPLEDFNYVERGYISELEEIITNLEEGILIIYKDRFNFYKFDVFYILLDFAKLLHDIRKDNYYKYYEFGHSISNALMNEVDDHLEWRGLFKIFRYIYYKQELLDKDYKHKTIELFEL
jgi:hypothetical protein